MNPSSSQPEISPEGIDLKEEPKSYSAEPEEEVKQVRSKSTEGNESREQKSCDEHPPGEEDVPQREVQERVSNPMREANANRNEVNPRLHDVQDYIKDQDPEEVKRRLERCPPDFTRARTHGFASKVNRLDSINNIQDANNGKIECCECCGRPAEDYVKDLPLCIDTAELDILGSGFPLYYHFKKFTIIIYFAMIFVVGIPCLVINFHQGRSSEWDLNKSYIISTTIGNHGKIPDNYTKWRVQVQVILNFLFIFVIAIASIFLRKTQNTIIREVDEQNITPSDFGVMISNIPKDKHPSDLKKWLAEKVPGIEIVYVNYCYNITEMVKATRKQNSLCQIRAYLLAYKKRKLEEEKITEEQAKEREISLAPPPKKILGCIKISYPQIDRLEKKIKDVERVQERIMETTKRILDTDEFCGKAFVVLNKQSHAERITKYFECSLLNRAFNRVLFNVFKYQSPNISRRYWDGNLIYTERAAEPGDIYWENLAVSTRTRLRKVLWTSSVAIFCLGAAFGINFGIRGIQKSIKNESTSSLAEEYFIRSLSILASFMIAANNMLLGRLIRVLTSYENHETYTKYHLSVAFKLTFAMFINTGINPLFANFGRKNWFNQGGLMVDIFYITITVSLISPFSYLFDPGFLIKLYKRWREKSKGNKSKLTQKQANELFEGPPLDMAQRYSNTMLLFCMAVFYAFPMPIISVISLLGAVFQYWLEKYLLLKRHKVPEPFGEAMAQIFSSMIPFFCLLYGTSLYIFSTTLSEGKGWIGLAAFIITLLYMILPFGKLLDHLKRETHRNDNYEYKEERIDFLTDYDRSNPITEEAANVYHQRKLAAANFLTEIQNQPSEGHNEWGGVLKYGRQATSLEGKVFRKFQHVEMLVGSNKANFLRRTSTQNQHQLGHLSRIEEEKGANEELKEELKAEPPAPTIRRLRTENLITHNYQNSINLASNNHEISQSQDFSQSSEDP
ncbi:unnamed protein product [Moneuplotes crassus]|uniref:CSC1/OSCA1-like cytosolic domain-containing protein n=1 Tax=Euplotes crassus TaxID=5936 RepID=A0AAD2D3G2_EUPCR|nr:unnamed protein product [Moneuplotes crassus]